MRNRADVAEGPARRRRGLLEGGPEPVRSISSPTPERRHDPPPTTAPPPGSGPCDGAGGSLPVCELCALPHLLPRVLNLTPTSARQAVRELLSEFSSFWFACRPLALTGEGTELSPGSGNFLSPHGASPSRLGQADPCVSVSPLSKPPALARKADALCSGPHGSDGQVF